MIDDDDIFLTMKRKHLTDWDIHNNVGTIVNRLIPRPPMVAKYKPERSGFLPAIGLREREDWPNYFISWLKPTAGHILPQASLALFLLCFVNFPGKVHLKIEALKFCSHKKILAWKKAKHRKCMYCYGFVFFLFIIIVSLSCVTRVHT